MADLAGQVALVTGGAIGIGREVALGLAAAGAEIAVTYHSHSPDDLAVSMAELGKQPLALPLDADSSQSVDEVVEGVYQRFGQLDIVVANAGGLLARVPLATMSDDHWHNVLEVNLSSAFFLVRAGLKCITKPGGRVILMSSMAAYTGGSGGSGAYAAAKAGLLGLTRALAKEVAPLGVTVNAVTPGLILGTPFHETFTTAEDQAAAIARLPIGRAGSPEDVAGLVAYLASAQAGFITGQVINVTGGPGAHMTRSSHERSRLIGDVVVKVRQGRLRGGPGDYGYRFLAIPYARPPAETGRFAAPEPASSWDGLRDANAFGATALQLERGVSLAREPLVPGSDCLNLNVFTPVLAPAGLPVLFWVHGGGFTHGGNASPWYNGANFARDGVVVVAINYRLGAEGFLLLPGAPPNRAVLDWVAALEWVQENIAVFGGDPAKVTIAGQSSGGGSCAALLAVPRARGLFRGSICMSGSAGLERNVQQATDVATRMAAIAGVELTRHDFEKLSDEALLAAEATVLDGRSQMGKLAALDVSLEGAYLPFGPVVEGEVMEETVLQAASSPANKYVTLMVGTTAHEFKTAMRDQDWITRDVLRDALVRSGARPDLVDEYMALHSEDNPAETAGQVKTDRGFRVPAHRLLEAWDDAAGTGFGYEFRWAPSDGEVAGVSVHAVDLPFAFDLLGVEGMEVVAGANPSQEVADSMHASFVSFAKDMSPGWPEYRAGERATMVFDVPPHVEYDPAARELELWGQAHRHSSGR